jgi:2-amino-4-hydroxy-6-hydroxymethyldihydropteridine diphosphokinase
MNKERIYIGLGSNLGQREKFLKIALKRLGESAHVEVTQVSPAYETEPVGFTGQNKYLNLVAEITSDLNAEELMDHLEEIESRVGKKAEFKNGPREIDIDILLFNQEVVETERLKIPHPGLSRREFALRPLLDINSKLVEPTTNTPYTVYLKRISGKKEVMEKKDLDLDPQADK